MTYDPVAFWTDLGQYIAGPGAASPEHERQERALEALLARLDWSSVCEVGVGGGRITDLIRRVNPTATYTGIDLGPAQLDRGRIVRPDGTFIQARLEDFTTDQRFDLVVVSEVLMHIVPERIEDAVANLLEMSRRHVVIVEWVPLPGELDKPVAPWNFPHDYRRMLGPVAYAERTDRQMLYHCEV